MTRINQKEAVYQTVCNVTGHGGEGACVPTSEQRKQINMVLAEGFKAGKIELSREFDEAGLKEYVSGLTSNWLRKDTRLNGGTKYVAKNPGSRAGASDPALKAMKALLTQPELSEDDRAEIQVEIDKRVAELGAAKAKVSVNFDHLPEALRSKFQK